MLYQLPIEHLKRGRFQPRREFDNTALEELAESIRSSGLIQPIVVRKLAADDRYEIIAGERRWRAAQIAGMSHVPCLIQNYTDEQAAAVTAIENIQRKSLNPIEEAQSLQRLIDEFGYSHEQVAAVIGKARSQVSNTLRLLRLDEKVQTWLIEGKLTEGHGKLLAALNSREQLELAKRCVDNQWSVRQIEQQLKKTSSQCTAPSSLHADIKRLEKILSDRFSTKVKLETDGNGKSGWVSIQFFDNEILQGLLEKMGVVLEE